ncbi:MAG: futalosine hydrolase [Ferruginibacter sp.]
MQILLVAATDNEIELFINAYPNLDILVTGVGAAACMYHVTKRLYKEEYDFVIQAGIAGAFTTELELGQAVLVKQDSFGDLGTEEKHVFTPCTRSGLIPAHQFPYADGWLMNMAGIPRETTLKTVKAVTVNKVTDDIVQRQQLLTVYNPQIETMEGAALHYACLMEDIPFVQLRSISNYVGERDKSKWKIKEAFESLSKELVTLINQITLHPIN